MTHYTEDGNRLIADKLFEGLKEESFFSGVSIAPQGGVFSRHESNSDYPGFDKDAKNELLEYKKILTEFYDSMFGITIGSIVMNCNPFTLGHRYLVEQAASRVDHLIIFVVQEDKSIFPFDDRLRLVDEGVADIDNVTVVPSGRF